MIVRFGLAVGSTYQAAAGAWETGTFFGSSNRVNACDSTSNNFMPAGVQLEKGSVATEFDVCPFAVEKILCERYYSKTFPYDTAPAQNAGTLGALSWISVNPSVRWGMDWRHPVTMRTTPTTTLYNPSAANAQARDVSGGADCSATSVGSGSEESTLIVAVGSAGSTQGNVIQGNVTANARF